MIVYMLFVVVAWNEGGFPRAISDIDRSAVLIFRDDAAFFFLSFFVLPVLFLSLSSLCRRERWGSRRRDEYKELQEKGAREIKGRTRAQSVLCPGFVKRGCFEQVYASLHMYVTLPAFRRRGTFLLFPDFFYLFFLSLCMPAFLLFDARIEASVGQTLRSARRIAVTISGRPEKGRKKKATAECILWVTHAHHPRTE